MELCLTTILIIVIIMVVACSCMGFFNILFEDNMIFEYRFIKKCKADAKKLRFLPRIIYLFCISIIEHSYNFGVNSGKFLKFLLVK